MIRCCGRASDVSEPKEILEENSCKCRDVKNEKGEITGKSCNRKIEEDGKIRFEKCCDESNFNEVKNEKGKTKCIKKPPPPPKLAVVEEPIEPQSKRPTKGKTVKKANISKKLK
tara:strand:- start:3419 stop:3760 length:342 start_codon:yes stop_codon:yes gene_type:complete